jgi:hypothetical protein
MAVPDASSASGRYGTGNLVEKIAIVHNDSGER